MTVKYGMRNIAKMIHEIDVLRKAIRSEGTPLIQDAWDRVEQHIDFAYARQPQGKLIAKTETKEGSQEDLDPADQPVIPLDLRK